MRDPCAESVYKSGEVADQAIPLLIESGRERKHHNRGAMSNTPGFEERLPQLIASACDGDEHASAEIYHHYVRAIYRLAYGVLLNSQDAEEVVQDTFSYALFNLGRYDPARSAFRTWLYTITMSRCRNKRRRRLFPLINLSDVIEFLPSAEGQPEHAAEEAGLRETIFEALRHISPKLREAVVLRYFDGLSYREMGDVLGCSQKTAESRVRLAHDALYRLLEERQDMLPEWLFTRG